MLPNPMHPALVHFPIVLALLLPPTAALAWYAIRRRGVSPARAWSTVVASSVLLFLATWASVRTGEAQEDRVESILVSEAPLHAHEEAAERFLVLAGLVLALAPSGLVRGPLGAAGRGATAIASLAAALAVVPVGHSGGELVYRHGAARAWTGPTAVPAIPPALFRARPSVRDDR